MRDLEATLRGAVRTPLRARSLSGRGRSRGARRARRPEPEAAALKEAEVRASQGARVSAQNWFHLIECHFRILVLILAHHVHLLVYFPYARSEYNPFLYLKESANQSTFFIFDFCW